MGNKNASFGKERWKEIAGCCSAFWAEPIARDIGSFAALEQLPQIRIWRQLLCLATKPI